MNPRGQRLLFVLGLLAMSSILRADATAAALSVPAGTTVPPPGSNLQSAVSPLTGNEPGTNLPSGSPAAAVPPTSSPDAQTLSSVIVKGEATPPKKRAPRESPAAQFFRTGTLAEHVGKKVTTKLGVKGDRGLMITFSH